MHGATRMFSARLLLSGCMFLTVFAHAQNVPEPPTVGAAELPGLLDKLKKGG